MTENQRKRMKDLISQLYHLHDEVYQPLAQEIFPDGDESEDPDNGYFQCLINSLEESL